MKWRLITIIALVIAAPAQADMTAVYSTKGIRGTIIVPVRMTVEIADNGSPLDCLEMPLDLFQQALPRREPERRDLGGKGQAFDLKIRVGRIADDALRIPPETFARHGGNR